MVFFYQVIDLVYLQGPLVYHNLQESIRFTQNLILSNVPVSFFYIDYNDTG